ncbi:MAG: hypothetical protein Ta2B_16010 [Termitinemataceae bacterium]|nr:MAG: hypothetical protein Ta2B_16010 [Termitinemataceae bacterium]
MVPKITILRAQQKTMANLRLFHPQNEKVEEGKERNIKEMKRILCFLYQFFLLCFLYSAITENFCVIPPRLRVRRGFLQGVRDTFLRSSVANITLHTRQKLIDILKTEYMLFAQARGETKRQAVRD